MNNCETCKHWERDERLTGYRLGVRRCNAVQMFCNCTTWNKAGDIVWAEDGATSSAFLQDASEYKPFLYTKATHGCTMHEAA